MLTRWLTRLSIKRTLQMGDHWRNAVHLNNEMKIFYKSYTDKMFFELNPHSSNWFIRMSLSMLLAAPNELVWYLIMRYHITAKNVRPHEQVLPCALR